MQITGRSQLLIRAPDAEEEVREAVRAIRSALDGGARSELIAAVSPATSPYLLLLHERLTAAGIAHFGIVPLGTRSPRSAPDAALPAHDGELKLGEPGQGVFVGCLHDLAAIDHDLVVVMGLVEGREPRSEHAEIVLRASRSILSVPRVDTRAGRGVTPSRWWLERLGDLAGERVSASTVGHVDHPDFRDIPSFQAGLESASTYADDAERSVAELLASSRSAGSAAATSALASRGPRSERAVAARASREEGRASPWTGFVGELPGSAPGAVGNSTIGSPTRFEQWASCPFHYFLSHVLGLEEPEPSAEGGALSGRDRGSLIHEVLERFHGDVEDGEVATTFSSADVARMEALLLEVGQERLAEESGNPSTLWEAERDSIARQLEAALIADGAHRTQRSVAPVAVEHAFGFPGGAPPVRIELEDGRSVAFRGKVDRIDASASGDRVVVIDYKTGSDRDYTSLPRAGKGQAADVTCRGRHLQLPIYAEAAAKLVAGSASLVGRGHDDELVSDGAQGALPPVDAYYWFLDGKTTPSLRGGMVGEGERRRVREVLGTIVSGIGDGHFPANPGEEGWFGPENCTRCPFDRLCPPSRVDRWEAVRTQSEIESYVEMAEGRP